MSSISSQSSTNGTGVSQSEQSLSDEDTPSCSRSFIWLKSNQIVPRHHQEKPIAGDLKSLADANPDPSCIGYPHHRLENESRKYVTVQEFQVGEEELQLKPCFRKSFRGNRPSSTTSQHQQPVLRPEANDMHNPFILKVPQAFGSSFSYQTQTNEVLDTVKGSPGYHSPNDANKGARYEASGKKNIRPLSNAASLDNRLPSCTASLAAHYNLAKVIEEQQSITKNNELETLTLRLATVVTKASKSKKPFTSSISETVNYLGKLEPSDFCKIMNKSGLLNNARITLSEENHLELLVLIKEYLDNKKMTINQFIELTASGSLK